VKQDLPLSSVCGRGRQVVETSTAHVSAQGIEDRGHRSRWSDACCSETPTAQYIIYNIKRAVWKLVSSCENDSAVCDLEFLLPLPRQKKSTTYPKHLPIKFPITSAGDINRLQLPESVVITMWDSGSHSST